MPHRRTHAPTLPGCSRIADQRPPEAGPSEVALVDEHGNPAPFGVYLQQHRQDPLADLTPYLSLRDGALVIAIDTCALSESRVLRVEVDDIVVYSSALFGAHPRSAAYDADILAPYLFQAGAAARAHLGSDSRPGAGHIVARPEPQPSRAAPGELAPPLQAVRALADYLYHPEHVDYLAQDREGRESHVLIELADLVRWLDIYSTPASFVAPSSLRSSLAGRWNPGVIEDVLATLSRAAGLRVVCGWDHDNVSGYGGDSQFYLVGAHGLYELGGGLWSWLSDDPATAPLHPGHPRSWFGAPVLDIELTAPDTVTHNFLRHRH